MATDIVSRLFGVTTDSYQQEQQARMDKNAFAVAQLDPFQQANYNINRGGSMLGGAVGGMLGGQDPELQRISMRQQIAGQINPNDLDSFRSGIEMMRQGGDGEGAFMLNQELQKILVNQSTIAKNDAQATQALAAANKETAPPTTSELTNARAIAALEGPIGSPEYTNALQIEYNRLTRKEDKTVAANVKEVGVAEGTRKPVYFDVNTNEQFVSGLDPTGKQVRVPFVGGVDRYTAKTNIDARSSNVQEKAELAARGKLLVDQYSAVATQAKVAVVSLPALETNLAILDKGFDTGFGTEIVAAGAKVLGALGVKDAEKFATNAQTFLGSASAAVLQRQLEQKGPQTESDAKRITLTGAQLGNTKDANKFLINVAKSQLKRDIAQRNFYDKWFKTNKTYDGAEDDWFSGEGGKSLFDQPELKQYGNRAAAAGQIPGQSVAAPLAAPVATAVSSNSVTLPDGRIKIFPNAEAANKFKKDAGL